MLCVRISSKRDGGKREGAASAKARRRRSMVDEMGMCKRDARNKWTTIRGRQDKDDRNQGNISSANQSLRANYRNFNLDH